MEGDGQTGGRQRMELESFVCRKNFRDLKTPGK
jgi:hypothetical protein